MNILKMIGDFNVNKVNNRQEESASRRVKTLLNEDTDFFVREAYNTARTNIIYSLGGEKGCKKSACNKCKPGRGKNYNLLKSCNYVCTNGSKSFDN